METLSSSVPTIKLPGFPSTSREFHHFKTPNTSNLPLSSTTKPTSISNKPTSIPHKTTTSPFFSPSQSFPHKPYPITHRKAASGYATALLDIAQCNNSLKAVEKDVRRLSKLLQNGQLRAAIDEKGSILKEVAEKGKFQRHLVVLMKMLVDKNKAGIVREVLEEFERIYDELSGTRVVLVSSGGKMEEDGLFGIAKRVQKFSGAMKVKVRHLIDESLPSFAA